MTRIAWEPLVRHAAEIVDSYDTPVTLRQLFYRLVSDGSLENKLTAYSTLSRETAKARRAGWFPALSDRGRDIHRYQSFDGPEQALEWLTGHYRLDRTEGQGVSLYIGVEKAGLVNLLQTWFSDMGIPILALGGYASQSYVDEIVVDATTSGRPAVLLYGGDFDPSGEDIARDFLSRTDCWEEAHRVALTAKQVLAYDLPPMMGKASDTRASAFRKRHGRLVQVELDALPPDTLRDLYQAAIAEYWDEAAYRAVMDREDEDRRTLARIKRKAGVPTPRLRWTRGCPDG